MESIAAIITTSPIRSHPSTDIINETVNSIRKQLPSSEIIIMVDGIREEQAYLSNQYNEYKQRLLNKCETEWTNVKCKIFETFSHQSLMVSETIKEINIPILLFTEHDMPLYIDREYQWSQLVKTIEENQADLIRFCMEPFIINAWQHMMIDKKPQIINGAPMLRTSQWSQRTHLASTNFYRRLMRDNFTNESRTFIEDKIHGLPGQQGWARWKLWIYAPEGDMQRCYTTDGRKDEPKYDNR